MVSSFYRLRFFPVTTGSTVMMFVLLLVGFPGPALAEWYVAGYGGMSVPNSLSDATLNNYGQKLAYQRYNFDPNVTNGNSLTQSFNTSNISLESSPLFGAKGGYFFRDQGFSWLGVEVEAFTSTPSIKNQTLNTTQNITYIKGIPGSPPCLPPPTANCSMQETRINQQQPSNTPPQQLTLTESSIRLITVAFNVVARYPGKVFQPYVGVGVGAFYFNSTGQIDGHQVVPGLNAQAGLKVLATEEWGLFVEGKYNYATITNLDPTGYGLSGVYSAFNILAGVAYHF